MDPQSTTPPNIEPNSVPDCLLSFSQHCTTTLHLHVPPGSRDVLSLSSLPAPAQIMRTGSHSKPNKGEHIARPPNAWILYRAQKYKQIIGERKEQGRPPPTQAEMSKDLAQLWRNESPEVKRYYEQLADVKKMEHFKQHPHYRFQPKSKEAKERQRAEQKMQREAVRAQKTKGKGRGASSSQIPPPSLPTSGQQPHFFYPQMHYGPQGPSPPLSAASSPTLMSSDCDDLPITPDNASPNSSVPPLPLDPTYKLHSFTAAAAAYPPLATPSPRQILANQFAGPPASQSNVVEEQEWSSQQISVVQLHAPVPSWPAQIPSQEGPASLIPEASSSSSSPPEFLDFNIPLPSGPATVENGVPELFQAIYSSAGAPGFFHLDVDPNLLTIPDGELELTPYNEQDFLDLAQLGFGDMNFFNGPQLAASTSTDYSTDVQAFLSGTNAGMDSYDYSNLQFHEFIDYGSSEVGGDISTDAPTDVLRCEPSAPVPAPVPEFASPSSSSYVPPPGAVHSSSRRVAATWKSPPFVMSEDSSPLETTPPKGHWGLSAN